MSTLTTAGRRFAVLHAHLETTYPRHEQFTVEQAVNPLDNSHQVFFLGVERSTGERVRLSRVPGDDADAFADALMQGAGASPLTNNQGPITLGQRATPTSAAPHHSSTPGGPTVAQQNSIFVQNPVTGAQEPQYIDVVLHGHVVPLTTLKRVLRADKRLKQQDIADLTAPHNNGAALHQTSVSGYLIGKQPMHDAAVAALEGIFPEPEAAALASGQTPGPAVSPTTGLATAPVAGGGAVSVPTVNVPGSAATSPAPVFAGAMAAAQGAPTPSDTSGSAALGAQVTAAVAQAAKSLVAFPQRKAMDLVADVRKAFGQEVSVTFSLRKLMAWAEAYLVLQHEGYSPNEALAGGFHLAAEGKTYGEDQRFLKDLFQAKFGFDAKPPKARAQTAVRDTRHPMSYLIEPMVRESKNVWLVGPTGAGKTHLVKDLAKRLGRKVYRFQGKGDATTDDFVGGFGLVEKNGVSVSEFQYGVLPLAMQEGALLYIDEITSLPPEVTFELHAVLEGDDLLLSKNRGEVVKAQPGFAVIAADNSLGLGEATEYVGTNVMNEAFRDRFLFVHVDYMPESLELRVLDQHLAGWAAQRGVLVRA